MRLREAPIEAHLELGKTREETECKHRRERTAGPNRISGNPGRIAVDNIDVEPWKNRQQVL